MSDPLFIPNESRMMSMMEMLEESDNEAIALTEPMIQEQQPVERLRSRLVRFARFNKRKILIAVCSVAVLSCFTSIATSVHRAHYRPRTPANNGDHDSGSRDRDHGGNGRHHSEDDDLFNNDDYTYGIGDDDDYKHKNDRKHSPTSNDDDYRRKDDHKHSPASDDDDVYRRKDDHKHMPVSNDDLFDNDDTMPGVLANVPEEDRAQTLIDILRAHGVAVPEEGDSWKNSTVPQSRAINWLAQEDPANLDFASIPYIHLIERYGIAVLFFATNGDEWNLKDGFLQGTSICDWSTSRMVRSQNGIYCVMEDFSVSEIILGSNNLDGTIPTEIALFANLKALRLGENGLHGSIPDELTKLTKLRSLDLSYNRLTGKIPSNLSLLPELRNIHLEGNSLGEPTESS